MARDAEVAGNVHLHLSLPAYPENSEQVGKWELRLSNQTRQGTNVISLGRLHHLSLECRLPMLSKILRFTQDPSSGIFTPR
jgi:hypothetical protein